MKFWSLSLAVGCIAIVLAAQTGSAQNPTTVKVLGCLQGEGSEQKPWVLAGVAIPPPPAAPPAGGAAAAPAPAGRGRGGRGGRGGGGAAANAPAPPPAPVQLVDLRLTGGLNMSLWRGMKIEVEGTLSPRPASGLQELRADRARSVQGVCPAK